MKIGKYIPLGQYKNVKIGYGTVDCKNLKTVYLKLNSWVQPNDDDDDHNFETLLSKSRKKIKNYINDLSDEKFKSQCIVDLDVKTKGIKLDKRSFMNLEITLFVNKQFDVKHKEVKEHIQKIITDIINDSLTNRNLFNFYKNKR
jgi:hypothetical protein